MQAEKIGEDEERREKEREEEVNVVNNVERGR
jgi:hypothetical protein